MRITSVVRAVCTAVALIQTTTLILTLTVTLANPNSNQRDQTSA